MQAGYGGDSGSAQLPEWLHFDPDNGLLFGAPFEKKIYFIQVQAVIDELVTIYVVPASKTGAFIAEMKARKEKSWGYMVPRLA